MSSKCLECRPASLGVMPGRANLEPGAMNVYDIRIPKKALQSLPDREQVLVLQFGHVCNELSFLNKLLTVVSDTESQGLKKKAMAAQSMIVVRLYIGKVFEAWKMIERDYFASQLCRSIDARLGPEGQKALEALKQYFGKSNLLSTVRNQFSFHYWSEHLPDAMNAFPDSHEFSLMLQKTYTNTLHTYAEDIATVAMLQATGERDAKAAMDRVVGDLIAVSGKMIDFLGSGLAAVLAEFLGKSWGDFEHTVHSVEPDANMETFKLPFFFDLNKQRVP